MRSTTVANNADSFMLEMAGIEKLAAMGSQLAAWAAAAWVALGAESIARPAQENYRDALWMVPFALTTCAFVALHLLQRSPEDRFEVFSFYSLLAASCLVFLGNVGVLRHQPVLAAFAFPWGALLWMLGLMLFGIATLMARVVPGYVAIAIILLEPGSLLTGLALSPMAPLHDRGAYSAGIEKGLVLAIMAVAMAQLGRKEIEA